MIGRLISHYKILEKLGQGGMSVVYKAEDTKLKRTVALKLLPLELTIYPEAKERFIQEAQAASALDHPNICTIHEIGEAEDEQMFICMACYDGESLKEKIESGPLKLEEAVGIAVQTAQGLHKAHKQGIAHRDIKPANILITKEGLVKLLDFGLAKLAGQARLTRTGMIVGTVAYMSPEQARGEVVDQRTDIWSLGCVLYEMVTGQLPFKGENEQAMVYLLLNEDPLPLASLHSNISEELEQVVNKSLAKSAGERYQNIEMLLDDLRSIESGLKTCFSNEPSISIKKAPSIAVLPFRDMSALKDQEYFCEGIAEELINTLAKIEGLKVVSRTSAFQFRDKAQDIREIGEQLGANTVLEGSVRKSGNKLRITAQLVKVSDGYHLWSEKYDREMEDIFSIQDEISLAIAEKLRGKLLVDEKSKLMRRYTDDPEAYTLYLKGRYWWNRRYEGGLQKGLEHFQKAIEKHPSYALAYAGLADSYFILSFWGFLRPHEAFPKAKTAANKALEIDDKLAEAHASLAACNILYDWNWVEGEKRFKRAIELNPDYASAYEWYAGFYFLPKGLFEDALVLNKQAKSLDPLSLILNSATGCIYYYARQFDDAIEEYRKVLDMDPHFLLALDYLGVAYAEKGMYQEAITVLKKTVKVSKNGIHAMGHLGYVYAKAGKRDDAQQMLKRLEALAKENNRHFLASAFIYAGLGDKDLAFESLEKAYEERDPVMTFLNISPELTSLHSDPRFTALLRKIGLK